MNIKIINYNTGENMIYPNKLALPKTYQPNINKICSQVFILK